MCNQRYAEKKKVEIESGNSGKEKKYYIYSESLTKQFVSIYRFNCFPF